MVLRKLSGSIVLAGLALGTVAATAAPLASMIKVDVLLSRWTITKNGTGKVKLFDQVPTYDDDGKLAVTPVAELKADGATYKLKTDKDAYWIMVYPHNCKVKLSLDFVKNLSKVSTATLNVDG